jgi:hypothetical protein
MAIKLEIIGVEPACYRCKETKENTDKAAAKLRKEGHEVNVTKLNVMDKSTMEKYGLVRTPALAINGVIKIMGKVPDPGVIERIIRKEL